MLHQFLTPSAAAESSQHQQQLAAEELALILCNDERGEHWQSFISLCELQVIISIKQACIMAQFSIGGGVKQLEDSELRFLEEEHVDVLGAFPMVQ